MKLAAMRLPALHRVTAALIGNDAGRGLVPRYWFRRPTTVGRLLDAPFFEGANDQRYDSPARLLFACPAGNSSPPARLQHLLGLLFSANRISTRQPASTQMDSRTGGGHRARGSQRPADCRNHQGRSRPLANSILLQASHHPCKLRPATLPAAQCAKPARSSWPDYPTLRHAFSSVFPVSSRSHPQLWNPPLSVPNGRG